MSPSAREPKNAYGAEPIAMPSGRNPVGRANSVGKTAGPWAVPDLAAPVALGAAEAGTATRIAAIAASAIPRTVVDRRRRIIVCSLLPSLIRSSC